MLYPTNESLNTITRTYDVVCWLTEHNKKNHERLWILGNKLRASEGRRVGGWDRPVMGIKEGTYCMVHWLLYANNESWNIASKTGDILYGD